MPMTYIVDEQHTGTVYTENAAVVVLPYGNRASIPNINTYITI